MKNILDISMVIDKNSPALGVVFTTSDLAMILGTSEKTLLLSIPHLQNSHRNLSKFLASIRSNSSSQTSTPNVTMNGSPFNALFEVPPTAQVMSKYQSMCSESLAIPANCAPKPSSRTRSPDVSGHPQRLNPPPKDSTTLISILTSRV